MKKKIDDEIFSLCLKYGTQSGNEYQLPISNKVVIDGRNFADEYEDCSSACPCCIDRISAHTNSDSLSFHMYSNFSSYFPLSSNDEYNFHSLKASTKKEILESLTNYCKTRKINKSYEKEMNRHKWLDKIKKYNDLYPRFKSAEANGEIYDTCGLKHSVDCMFCCGDENVEEGLKAYLDILTFDIAAHIRIQYKSSEDLYEDMYLSKQSGERRYRLYKWIKVVYKKAEELCPNDILNIILSSDPDEVLKSKGFKFNKEKLDEVISTRNNKDVQLKDNDNQEKIEVSSFTKIKSVEELEKLRAVYNNTIQVGKLYWKVTSLTESDSNISKEIISCELVSIISNRFKKPDVKMELSDEVNSYRPYEYSYSYYTDISGYNTESEIEYLDIKSGAKNIIDIRGASNYQESSNTSIRFYDIPEVKYEVGEDRRFLYDEMFLKTKKEAKQQTLKEHEHLFKLIKSLYANKRKSKNLATVTDKSSGLEWTITNVVSNGLEVHKRKYDLMHVIPKGYRLPTQAEIKELLASHVFVLDDEETNSKSKKKKEIKKRFFRNDLGMYIEYNENIHNRGFSSKRNLQPVCWTSFDEVLIEENPIFCPYYKFIDLSFPKYEYIVQQSDLMGDGAYIFLIKQSKKEEKEELDKNIQFIKENIISFDEVLKACRIPNISEISYINFDINVLDSTEREKAYRYLKISQTKHFKKNNLKQFEILKESLSKFTNVDNIHDLSIIIKDKEGNETFVNQYEYGISMNKLLAGLLLMTYYPKYSINLGIPKKEINLDEILYLNNNTFFVLQDFLHELGINDSYYFSYSRSDNYHYKNMGFSCTGLQVYTQDGKVYNVDSSLSENLNVMVQFYLEYYILNF